MSEERKTIRIAAVADIHYTKDSAAYAQPLFTEASKEADVLLLCGDLTDYGLPEEAELLAHDIRAFCTIPVLAVLGNHDHESGQAAEIINILNAAGVKMIDGECTEINGVGFAGICGFGGGFDSRMLSSWGEPLIKAFVQEAIDQAMHLERALARLNTQKRVVLCHYSPIAGTVQGEPLEIYPFLGSSRLEGPLTRFNVDLVVHGHAHNGSPEGTTKTGVPVYNVALPLLRKQEADAWFKIFELEI